MQKIKLIWDFKGPTGLGTAKHHCIHLEEFAIKENLVFHEVNHTEVNELWATAYIVVNKEDLFVYRDALKPHRGEIFNRDMTIRGMNQNHKAIQS